MKQKNGGGKRFVVYSDEQPLTIEDLKEKGALLFFKNGKSNFAGNLCDMTVAVCDATETAVFEFPGGKIDGYLQSNGLYHPRTSTSGHSQKSKELMVEEFDDIDSHDRDTSESIESTLPLAEPINNHGQQCSQD